MRVDMMDRIKIEQILNVCAKGTEKKGAKEIAS